MEIAFRKKDATAIFRDERVGVSELSARFIQMETGTAGKPNGGNTGVIESSRELVEPRHEASAGWDKAVNGDVQDEGSVVQAGLRNAASILAEIQGQAGNAFIKQGGEGEAEVEKTKRAGIPARFASLKAETAECRFRVFTLQKWLKQSPAGRWPWECLYSH